MVKNRFVIVFMFASMTWLLAGCNQSVDELLKTGEDVLNSIMNEEETSEEEENNEVNEIEVGTNEVEEEDDVRDKKSVELSDTRDEAEEDMTPSNPNVASSNDQETESDYFQVYEGEPFKPFHQRLQEQGYELYSLPNGFPFNVPYHWVLVNGEFGTDQHYFSGDFCFEVPYKEEELIEEFGRYTGASIHNEEVDEPYFAKTTYTLNSEIANTEGQVNYYKDEHDNTCARVTVDDSTADIFYPLFGEDPTTMVGPEDGDYDEDFMNEDEKIQLENFHIIDESRERSLPDDFEEIVQRLQTNSLDENDRAKSVRQGIMDGEVAFESIDERFMRVLPYEWYALSINREDNNWSGKLCTDLTTEQSIKAHLDMLQNYNANIIELTLSDGDADELGSVTYSFNDPYFTGSWSGKSTFNKVENSGEIPSYRCVDVHMDFSSEIMNENDND